MDNLYGERCGVCGGFHNQLEQGFEFSKEALTQMLRDIYDGMNVRDDIQRDAFEETLRLFNEATVEGLSASSYPTGDELFLEQLRTNNEVFSAFRTHRMQNDLAAQLIDKDGKLKPFELWLDDVQNITDHYVVRWLRTEYDTAILRAHQAADWKYFEEYKDVLPNLRWMPTTSPDPDIAHKQYWEAKLTLPVNHSFWTRHRPGDRWNCKCSLEATGEPATTDEVGDFKPVPSVPGLDNNPADDGKLFSDSHPYIKEAYPGAKKAVEKIVNKPVLDTAFDKKVTDKVTSIEDEIRMNKNFETAVAVDKNSNVIFRIKGSQSDVQLSVNDAKKLKDCILTHNHPGGWKYDKNRMGHIGASFSLNDIVLAINYDLEEIRAVTPLYTFSLKRPDKGWGVKSKTLIQYYRKKDRELKTEHYYLREKGMISEEVARAIHSHELIKRVAKQYKLEYSKLKTRYE